MYNNLCALVSIRAIFLARLTHFSLICVVVSSFITLNANDTQGKTAFIRLSACAHNCNVICVCERMSACYNFVGVRCQRHLTVNRRYLIHIMRVVTLNGGFPKNKNKNKNIKQRKLYKNNRS